MKPHCTRRHFLTAASAVAASAALPRSISAKPTGDPSLAADPMRPQFHLLPARNWMNDPNGPIYFNGRYHMFFQYNPLAATWGDMSWNHAVSRDMLHWDHLPLAMTPTPNSPDSFGVFSGSALAVGKRVYAVYTGTQKSSDALATIRDGANNIQETQCLAWSDDPQLIRWTKDPQPIIPRPPAGLDITGFRDPSVWKQGTDFYMTVGSGIAKSGGCVLLYRSHDLKHWDYLHPLTSGTWNGSHTPNPCDDGEMWECPEFFPLGDPALHQHVLIYSTLGKVFWQSGTLDANRKFTMGKTGELDLGGFYAPKTQLDAHGNRILWGWIQERRSEDAMRAAGWSGLMSLPRVMTLDPDGTLRLRILPATSTLRSATLPVSTSGSTLSATIPAATGELLCSPPATTADFDIRILDTTHNTELLHVRYTAATHSFTTDGHTIILHPADAPTVHAFLDGSVLELILGSRIGYTKRFYYTGPAPSITIQTTGPASLSAWTIAPISPNRLTTPAPAA